MVEKEFKQFSSDDNKKISYQVWFDNEVETKALFQIIHGYAEWVDRYDEFAEFMAKNGFIVFGEDHRGHGHTREGSSRVIHFDDTDGFEKVVDDNYKLTCIMKNLYPAKKMFVFGHSMGSFILRRYIQKYSHDISAAIICGTGNNSTFLLKFGNWIAKRHVRKNGPMFQDYKLDKLCFGMLNRGVKHSSTGLDWVCRDPKVTDHFYQSNLRGIIATSAFFRDFTQGMWDVRNKENIALIRKELPVLFVSGQKDPVGGKNGAGPQKAYCDMKDVGLKNVSIKIYQQARHELLNEYNKKEVSIDLLNWVSQYVQ